MEHTLKAEEGFKYYEEGEGEVLMLLHGLFGALSNFKEVIEYFNKRYQVVVPLLPLYDLPLDQSHLKGMLQYLEEFITYKDYKSIHLLGNSLGGHLALMYVLEHRERVHSLTLTGSSGLFENSLGDTYPKKSDYEYVREKTASTFYNPAMASKDLVDEVYTIVNDREKALRMVVIAKSALRHNVRDRLPEITQPSLLLWGEEDDITPPAAAEEFHQLLPNSELIYIAQCKHAPMMEQPEEFNRILSTFLSKHPVVG